MVLLSLEAEAEISHSQTNTCLSGFHRNDAGHTGHCCFHGDPNGSWEEKWMLSSQRTSGNLELKQEALRNDRTMSQHNSHKAKSLGLSLIRLFA